MQRHGRGQDASSRGVLACKIKRKDGARDRSPERSHCTHTRTARTWSVAGTLAQRLDVRQLLRRGPDDDEHIIVILRHGEASGSFSVSCRDLESRGTPPCAPPLYHVTAPTTLRRPKPSKSARKLSEGTGVPGTPRRRGASLLLCNMTRHVV